jgi:hypothetical protein
MAFGGVQYVYEDFDERGFSSAVGTDEGVDAAFGNGEGEVVERSNATVVFAEGFGFDGTVHRLRPVTIASTRM